MASKAALLQRLEQLEGRDLTASDAWWRGLCERFGFPVIPIDDVTEEQRRAVMNRYLDEFY